MAISKAQLLAATERGQVNPSPKAIKARYDARAKRLVIDLDSGLRVLFKPGDAQGLQRASEADLRRIEISPSGLGLHIPTLDADLFLPAILEGFLGSVAWMHENAARKMGRAGGQCKSESKAQAARANGQRGGRPRKAVVEA